MNCRKAWKLMLKSFDKEVSKLHEKELNKHIDECGSCKARLDKLTEIFTFMQATKRQAPPDIEKRVMEKLGSVKHKGDYLMPYVICNIIIFVGFIAIWLDSVIRTGIFTLIKDIFYEAVVAYNTSTTVFAAFRGFFSAYFIKPTINIAIIAFLIYGSLSVVSIIQKMRRRYASVR